MFFGSSPENVKVQFIPVVWTSDKLENTAPRTSWYSFNAKYGDTFPFKLRLKSMYANGHHACGLFLTDLLNDEKVINTCS